MSTRHAFFVVALLAVGAACLADDEAESKVKRQQASDTLNGARILDAAIDQWAIEHGIGNGMPMPPLADLAVYVGEKTEPSKTIRKALLSNTKPVDPLGNEYVFGVIGPNQLKVSEKTKGALGDLVKDWGPY